MSYRHITIDDRYCIQSLIKLGLSNRAIAIETGFSHTAINKELSRNGIPNTNTTSRVNRPTILDQDLRAQRGRGLAIDKYIALEYYCQRQRNFRRRSFKYKAETAQNTANIRRHNANQLRCKIIDGSPEADIVKTYLAKKYSPEIITIRSKLVGDINLNCSKTAIYGWINRSSDSAYLKTLLRRKGRKPKHTVDSFNKTSNKRSIHDRPTIVKSLGRIGDLEGDTIVGKDTKDRLLTHVDRLTGKLSISRIISYDSFKVSNYTRRDIERIFNNTTETITYDNGNEFSAWELTEKKLAVDIYFADVYKSNQRGRNENANGLIRQYFPKGTDFKKITNQQVRYVENELNNRPRKRYNGLTPIEYENYLVETFG